MPERIKRLNSAGLDHMQISIDNIQPDEVSKKSLKVLDKKLEFLAQHAEFHVNINSVVGGGIKNPQDALVIGKRALELGFTSTIGIIHDGEGQLKALKDEERRVYYQMAGMAKKNYSRFNKFQEAIANGVAGPAHVSCTSAKTGWCTIAHNSADTQESRWHSTPRPTSSGNT